MIESLNELKSKRESFLIKLKKIGDFRRGTITLNYRKCGKKNCICAKQKGHPGHGPQYLWSITKKGKSYAKKLTLGPELEKYKKEIDNYRDFQRLCDKILEINEKICELKPIPAIDNQDELETLKKKLQNLYRRKYKKRLTA